MSEFKGTPGPYEFVPIDKFPFGYEIKAGDDTLASQDSAAWASGQKTREDNLMGIGFPPGERAEVVAAIAKQESNGKLFAASFDLLEACQIAREWFNANCAMTARESKFTVGSLDAAIRKATS